MAEGFKALSRLAEAGTPFAFVVSYDKREVYARPLRSLKDWRVAVPGFGPPPRPLRQRARLSKHPVPFSRYVKAFERVIEEIRSGNTYLLNLTFPTPVTLPLTLEALFESANAPYRFLWPGRFVCFSPEPFVRIDADGRIATFPMKGTIDAAVPDAEAKILANEKEMAEHVMVVDLLRNDLGMVAKEVRVRRFRYVERLSTHDRTLLQVSSHIEARLPSNWRQNLGEILQTLLPAGSVTGTPKRRTCQIIELVEGYDRGFFTGVFGLFDGQSLQSAVMIRFIEQTPEGLLYKSGGGITIDSDPKAEYEELLAKVYLPL